MNASTVVSLVMLTALTVVPCLTLWHFRRQATRPAAPCMHHPARRAASQCGKHPAPAHPVIQRRQTAHPRTAMPLIPVPAETRNPAHLTTADNATFRAIARTAATPEAADWDRRITAQYLADCAGIIDPRQERHP